MDDEEMMQKQSMIALNHRRGYLGVEADGFHSRIDTVGVHRYNIHGVELASRYMSLSVESARKLAAALNEAADAAEKLGNTIQKSEL